MRHLASKCHFCQWTQRRWGKKAETLVFVRLPQTQLTDRVKPDTGVRSIVGLKVWHYFQESLEGSDFINVDAKVLKKSSVDETHVQWGPI